MGSDFNRMPSGGTTLMAWLALGLTVETALFTLAGLAWLLSMEYTLAEAGAGAIMIVFMALSFVHQLSWWVGSPWPAFILESVALTAIFVFGSRRLPNLARALTATVGLLRKETYPGLIIAAVWAAMAGLVAANWLSADVAGQTLRIGSMPTGNPLPWLVGDAILPLNAAALFFHTGRFGLTPGACGFGLMAYMTLGLSTYALARRYAWPPMALTVTLLVLSMPRLVLLGRWPTAELISASAVGFAMVLIYRLLEQHRSADLRFFMVCILFSIYDDPMSLALVAVMTLLMVVVMIRRHGWLLWWELAMAKPWLGSLCLVPAFVAAQIPVILFNLYHGHPLLGSTIAFDSGGWLSAVANLIRYLLVSVDPTEPVHRFLYWAIGLDISQLLTGFYRLVVLAVDGGTDSFAPVFSGADNAGFGPFALLLVLPAMIHALVRGPRRLKALGVAWMGYVYLAALVVAWDPANLAVLTPVYAANGFIVAFSLPPWRLRRRGMRILQLAFGLLLVWSLVCGPG